MKTVKQVADEIGVTKNAIIMKIKRNPEFAKQLDEHLDNDFVDDVGEAFIKANIKPRSNDVNNVTDNVINVISNVIGVTADISAVTTAIIALKTENIKLQSENKALLDRITDKDKQIAELQRLLGEQTKERQAYSIALLAANNKLSEVRHLSLTDRLFGWNNVQSMLTDSSIGNGDV